MKEKDARSVLWHEIRDGNSKGLSLYERHYSCRHYRDGRKRKLFVGPGERLVLLTKRADALFVWRKFVSMNDQTGVSAAVFRNEGQVRSSVLIREAMERAWQRWPGQRFYTYVNPTAIRSTNPGYCFLQAGWKKCGWTKGRLIILEVRP